MMQAAVSVLHLDIAIVNVGVIVEASRWPSSQQAGSWESIVVTVVTSKSVNMSKL